jgi:hypothetical protein
MNTHLLVVMLAAMNEPGAMPECASAPPAVRRSHLGHCWDYHAKVCRGTYVRPWYDYRLDFDYPWHAGPSQQFWPIAPLASEEPLPCALPVLPARYPCPPGAILPDVPPDAVPAESIPAGSVPQGAAVSRPAAASKVPVVKRIQLR